MCVCLFPNSSETAEPNELNPFAGFKLKTRSISANPPLENLPCNGSLYNAVRGHFKFVLAQPLV